MDIIIPDTKPPRRTRSIPPVGRDRLVDWFDYNPKTGAFRWRKRPMNGGWNRKVGDDAGTVNTNGRHVLWLGKRRIYAARAAYIITHGDIPQNALIDHIDGDITNNRAKNLRLASAVQNVWNRLGKAAGLKGVAVDVKGNFKARIEIGNGKKLNLGTWKTAEEAHAAYMGAAAVLHGEFWLGNRPQFQKAASTAIAARRA